MSQTVPTGSDATPVVPAPSPALAAPPANPRFPLFDGLRGVAVLSVLMLHSSELAEHVGVGVGGRLAEIAGGLGVVVFFVISGFLLYRPFVNARVTGAPRASPARYLKRRALRILPAYWAILTILGLFPGITDVFTGHWFWYYGFLQVYLPHTYGIPVAWTLCVEVTFYAALPLYAFLIARRGRPAVRAESAVLAVLALIGFALQILAARRTVPVVLASTLPGELPWFALGMALAVASVAERTGARRASVVEWLAQRPSLCWAVSAAAVAGLAALVPGDGELGLFIEATTSQPAPRSLLKLALTALVVGGLVFPAVFSGRRPGLPRLILGWRPLIALGVISYSFYLWHFIVVEFLAVHRSEAFSATGLDLLDHVHSARTTVLYLASLVVTAALATGTYRLIELPFLRRKERGGPGRRDGGERVDPRILGRS